MKIIENGKSIAAIGTKKKLFLILAIIALLCLAPMFVIWASPQSNMLSLVIDATGDFGRKGNCFQASLGTIDVELSPTTYSYVDEKEIGNVSSSINYGYHDLASLTLVTEITVHIHIDGSFRRLSEGDSAPITLLEINGCTSVSPEGEQYCIYVYAGNVGTVTKTGPYWQVDALIPAPEQGAQSLCVNEWSEGEVVNGFCVPLHGFTTRIIGTLTK